MTDNVVPIAHPFRLQVVDPARLYEIWPAVRLGLLSVIAKTNADWLPEDVYAALKTKAATLLTTEGSDWFIVAQQQGRAYGSCLFIWVLYAPGDYKRFAARVYPELERLAREIGAVRLEMHSPRRGWQQEPYWSMRETIFIHEVTNK